MRGFRQIFAFTFLQHIQTGKYKKMTISLAVLFFLLPVVILSAIEIFSDKESETMTDTSQIEYIYMVDQSRSHLVDIYTLTPPPEDLFRYYEDVETALNEATDYTLVLLVEEDEDGRYTLQYIIPEDTKLKDEVVWSFQSWMDENARGMIAYQRFPQWQYGKYLEQQWAMMEEEIVVESEDALAEGQEILGMLLPYVNIMLLYFLVLFYGQGVANSVVMEKSSKLMDTFLISVKPEAMIFGKVFGIAAAGMMQFLIWIAAVVAGFAGGIAVVKAINPDTQMMLITLMEYLMDLKGAFTVGGTIIGILMVLGGFLLYCSLASIGGAIAGKAEDLSSTNMLFTLILVISFLCVLYAGGLQGMASSETWLNWVPFTSIMVTPSRILLGMVKPLEGIVSMLIVYAAAVLVMWLAARVYKLMSLYSGKVPSFKKVFMMLRGR